jgi:predicted ATP-grasp superfamily ATP-dependent carboligase
MPFRRVVRRRVKRSRRHGVRQRDKLALKSEAAPLLGNVGCDIVVEGRPRVMRVVREITAKPPATANIAELICGSSSGGLPDVALAAS